jgi:hypothetical protein
MRPLSALSWLLVLALPGCGLVVRRAAPEPPPPPAPAQAPASVGAGLEDTTVCVVDRTTREGLRLMRAKVDGEGRIVVPMGEALVPLDELHPVAASSGYAGAEEWMVQRAPIPHGEQTYVAYESERRIPADLIHRVGAYRGIPLFADPAEASPVVLYVPTRPGCIFQPYLWDQVARR